MDLIIKNSTRSKNIVLCLVKENRRMTRKIKLDFNETRKTSININLSIFRYCYFLISGKRSEKVILSENIFGLEIRYNRRTHRYDPLLFVEGSSDYGSVETIVLEDKINLPIAKHNCKNVHILTPANYDEKKRYGLIIMIDGQNLFDQRNVGRYTRKNDPYGGWQIDVSLKGLCKIYPEEEYIVASIETTGYERMFELTPSASFGVLREGANFIQEIIENGLLEHTSAFIMNTLIPYIENKYNIDKSRIGISGSSAGGCASLYIGLKEHETFSFILPFSPCLSVFSDDSLFRFYERIGISENNSKFPYIFYNIGKKGRLEKMLYLCNEHLLDNLVLKGYKKEKLASYVENNADHNEIIWRYAFNYGILNYVKNR